MQPIRHNKKVAMPLFVIGKGTQSAALGHGKEKNSQLFFVMSLICIIFAVSCGPFRLETECSQEAKRAFPLSSFTTQSGKFHLNRDERDGTPPVYVSYACGLRRCSSIYGVGIFVSSSFVQRFTRACHEMSKDKSLRLSCIRTSNTIEP